MSVDAVHLEKICDLLVRESPQPGRPAHVSAASGLVRHGEYLYVVADDEAHLAIFPASSPALGRLARILPDDLPLPAAQRKRLKPDFESLVMLRASQARPHGALLALGSGSTAERRRGVIVPFNHDRTLRLTARQTIDLTQLFEAARDAIDATNIEGAVATLDSFLLFQRGNKGDGINAIVRFDLAQVCAHLDGSHDRIRPTASRTYELGTIRDIPLSFSDAAALDDGSIVFCAIAEDTADAYADGPCAGAAIGIIDRTGAVRHKFHVSGGGKIEGIHAEARASSIAILCVSDADDATVPAALYEGALPVR